MLWCYLCRQLLKSHNSPAVKMLRPLVSQGVFWFYDSHLDLWWAGKKINENPTWKLFSNSLQSVIQVWLLSSANGTVASQDGCAVDGCFPDIASSMSSPVLYHYFFYWKKGAYRPLLRYIQAVVWSVSDSNIKLISSLGTCFTSDSHGPVMANRVKSIVYLYPKMPQDNQ